MVWARDGRYKQCRKYTGINLPYGMDYYSMDWPVLWDPACKKKEQQDPVNLLVSEPHFGSTNELVDVRCLSISALLSATFKM